MKLNRKLALMFAFSLLTLSSWSQAISLTPSTPNPTTFNLTSITSAGGGPTNVINKSQSLKYNYPSNLPGTGAIDVTLSSGTIPSGMQITIEVADSGWKIWEGISTGPQILSTTPQTITTTIFTTKLVTHLLTMTISVTDMAALHPGTNPITVMYTLYQN